MNRAPAGALRIVAIWVRLTLLLGCLGTTARGQELDAGALGAVDGARAVQAWAQFEQAGAQGVGSLLEGFEQASVPGRVARGRLLARFAGPEQVPRLLALCGAESDPEVLRAMISFAGRAAFGDEALEERMELLEQTARSGSGELRRGALQALGSLDRLSAAERLERLVGDLPRGARVWAAQALPSTPRADGSLERLLRAGFAGPVDQRTPADVLAVLLPRLGKRLAEREDGGDLPHVRAPLVLALRHPSRRVRLAGIAAYETLMDSLRALGEAERTEHLLNGLLEQGFDPRLVQFQRARFAFFPAGDGEAALLAARALVAASISRAPLDDDPQMAGDRWLARGQLLEGLALVSLGRAQEARGALILAAASVEARLAKRMDRGVGRGREAHVEVLQEFALVQISRILAELAAGAPGGAKDGICLALARSAHTASLEAQALYAELQGEAMGGWDSLLDANISPYRLLFTGLPHVGMDLQQQLVLQLGVARVLASVSPGEMPGFRPYDGLPPELADPLEDPDRLALLESIQIGRLDGVQEDLEQQRTRVLRLQSSPLWEVPQDALVRLQLLDRRRRMMLFEMNQKEGEDGDVLLELRLPASIALWLSRDLQREGRGEEARATCRRYQDDLQRTGISNWWYYLGQERLARADIAIGSSWTDDDEPLKAQAALLRATERLRSIEDQLLERGAGPQALAPYRALRSTALVSLAVNANVKLAQPERALEFYEQAYELRQDDFMRVLLACYRARFGREVEARALLREIRPGPGSWYNLACTYALLGDTEEALRWLETELEGNHPTPASLARQQAWAAEDPDLASLREDPRFQRLVGSQ
ncbi:MAG: tetratricopeptide (TPR) repeat protein [Planctomycetota bacterium]|jgi:tetratricopeptide (TPR) repeat protein